jgi:hypothetical protein
MLVRPHAVSGARGSPTRVTAGSLAFAAAICSLHMGANEFASIQFAGFALLALLGLRVSPERLIALFAPGLAILLVLLAGYFVADHETNTLLRGIRVAAVMLVYLSVQRAMMPQAMQRMGNSAFGGVLLATFFSLILAALQLFDSFYFNSGRFDIPQAFFALNYGTVFGEQREWLSRAGYFIRPSAFFSEPSSLAAVGLVGVVASYSYSSRLLRLLAFGVIGLSMSLNGLIFGVMITVIEGRRNRTAIWSSVAILAAAAAIVLYSPVMSDRLMSVLSGRDASAEVRLSEPIRIGLELLSRNEFFGASEAKLRSLSVAKASIFDNWVLNQLMFYGILGVAMIWLALVVVPRRLWHLALAFAFLNGELFYYDRLILLWIAYLLVASEHDRVKDNHRNRDLQQLFRFGKHRPIAASANLD